jgi:hypothetical protein
MSTPNSTPLPENLTPSTGGQVDPVELARRTQANFDALALQIGSNSSTTVAPIALTGLYSGTWGPYSYIPYYRKVGGMVDLGGAVTTGGAFTPGLIFTLPAGFRPSSTNDFACIAVGAAGTTGVVIVQVTPSGTVTFVAGVTGGGLANPMVYINLAGVTFGAGA